MEQDIQNLIDSLLFEVKQRRKYLKDPDANVQLYRLTWKTEINCMLETVAKLQLIIQKHKEIKNGTTY